MFLVALVRPFTTSLKCVTMSLDAGISPDYNAFHAYQAKCDQMPHLKRAIEEAEAALQDTLYIRDSVLAIAPLHSRTDQKLINLHKRHKTLLLGLGKIMGLIGKPRFLTDKEIGDL